MEVRPDPKKGGHDVLLGKYEIGRLLGRGTFAKVYHARSVADETTVAVKVLDKKELAAARMAPLILREVDAMSRLSHPNILRLHEVMATKTKIYLVMEYAPGGELLSRLTRRLPEQTARRYFNQLLSALRFCHARGVAHRDVKPQNLLLDGQGLLKVSDFGLSALPDNLRDGRLHTSCGTPAYAAPEVLQGKPYDGTRADAWSCGVILYVLLAGKLPFDDSNLALMFRKIIKREYEFPPWFPQPAKRVVSRLLDPNPETRLTLEKLTELPWLKRSYSLDNQLNLMGSGPRLDRSLTVPMMNAFDIISMSPGLDLSGLFGGGGRGVRFTSKAEVGRVLERIDEMGAKLGFGVQRRKGGGRGSVEWGKVVTVDVSVVEGPMVVVEMKTEGSGDGVNWELVKAELDDVVYEWKSNTGICEEVVNCEQ